MKTLTEQNLSPFGMIQYMESSGGSNTRIILVTGAMAIAGGSMLVRIVQGDGGIWAVIAMIVSLIVVAIGVSHLVARHL